MVVSIITPAQKKFSLYSDFHKDMTQNPISLDLAVKRDEEAVRESIKNLILTNKGERLFQPLLGGNVTSHLFENNTPATTKLIQEQIKATINQYEPRAQLIDVVVQSSIDDNRIEVTIYFYISNIEQPVSVTVFLERTR
jgi:phage baseplate assembly protein W